MKMSDAKELLNKMYSTKCELHKGMIELLVSCSLFISDVFVDDVASKLAALTKDSDQVPPLDPRRLQVGHQDNAGAVPESSEVA
jgi:hypothetical protein